MIICQAGKGAPMPTAYGFKMRQLPKSEYHLLKAVIAHYNLEDASEAVSVALRLLYEVTLYQDGHGEQWLLRVIDDIRSIPDTQRVYAPLVQK
jgi:hypothetical protein